MPSIWFFPNGRSNSPTEILAAPGHPSLLHADIVALELYEPADPDLTEVTAKTFLDIQIDAKPAGWCTVATVKTRC